MSDAVWINGVFVERDAARVSAFDAGLQHGVGLFETMLAVGGRVHRVFDHLERLNESARTLGLTASLHVNPLAEAVRRTVARSGLDRARVRLTMTGGDLNMLSGGAGAAATAPTIVIHAQPATAHPPEMFERGVNAVVADVKLNPLDPFEGHKTINYWKRLRELRMAAGKGAGEALFLQVTNHVCGGAVSNIFVVKEGAMWTPYARGEEGPHADRLPSPALPGVTRRTIIEAAASRGIEVQRRLLSVSDVLDADEVFLTNSSWGVLPVVRVEAKQIGDGVGARRREARAWWLASVEGAADGA